MITCRELIDFIMDYVDGTLPADQRRRFEEHLGVCPECVAYVNGYKAAVGVFREACGCERNRDLDVPMPDAVVKAILAARRGSAGSPAGSAPDSAG